MMKCLLTLIILFVSLTSSAFTLTQNNLRGFRDKKLRVSLNPANCITSIESELDFAIELWNNVPGSRLELIKESQNSVATSSYSSFGFVQTILIGCSTNFSSDAGGAGLTTIGVGSSTMQGTGRLVKGFLILNEEGGAGQYSTQSQAVRRFTMAHELGHVLGLGHSSVSEGLMYPSVSSKADTNLHQDDMDGIIYLYPLDEMDEGLYGCGRIESGGPLLPGPKNLTLLFVFLLLPLFLWARLKKSTGLSFSFPFRGAEHDSFWARRPENNPLAESH
ncbi:MAG: matrixin family metalloprotease [Bdellovibrionota bacterium]